LLKGFDEKGFVFFTNYESQKGRELARKSTAGLLFYWPTLARQVRVDGRAVRVSARESDEYFHSRPRGSQISAWVSRQSQRVPDREYLENKTVEFEKRFKGKAVARPPYWGGYRLVPDRFEFWSGKPNRLHDRLRYVLQGRRWLRERLSP
jgi:pyridoxamine 5'-phosphate oxidase